MNRFLLAAWGMVGVAAVVTTLAGAQRPRSWAMQAGSSPLPVVFAATAPPSPWAEGGLRLELTLDDGETKLFENKRALLEGLSLPHRVAMLVVVPFVFDLPFYPRLRQRHAHWILCHEASLARLLGPQRRVRAYRALVEARAPLEGTCP